MSMLRQSGLQHTFNEMICSQVLALDRVFTHPVGELVNMATRLQDRLGRENGAVYFHHALLDDKMLAPLVDDVGLQGTSWGAVVVKAAVVSFEAAGLAIHLEGFGEEEAALEERLEVGAAEGLASERGCIRHLEFR